MPSLESVSLKELVDLVEERIPGGRTVTTVVLCLIVLVAIVASLIYLKDHAIVPVFNLIHAAIVSLANHQEIPAHNDTTSRIAAWLKTIDLLLWSVIVLIASYTWRLVTGIFYLINKKTREGIDAHNENVDSLQELRTLISAIDKEGVNRTV